MSPQEKGWFKSSFSSGTANCVEVRFIERAAQVRNCKDREGPMLVFQRGEWEAFVLGVFNGEFEMPC